MRSIHRVVPGTRVVVVDDGSVDNTAKAAIKAGALAIFHKANLGCGWAVKSGLTHVLKREPTAVIIIDADGQHDPSYIPILLEAMHNGVDCVIASRYVNSTEHVTSWMRRLGTRLISNLILWRYGTKIADPTSGFRAYSRRAVKFLESRYPTIFPEPETITLLLDRGYTITEIPSQMKPRRHGRSSISTIKAIQLMWHIARKLIFRRNPVDKR